MDVGTGRPYSSPMGRRERWWVLTGTVLLALLSASCSSDQVGTPAADFTLELGTGGTFVLS